MSLTNSERLEAIQSLSTVLEDHIYSPEARAIEVEFRLDTLQSLVSSGEWDVDDKGNVFPSDISQEDRETILEHCRFSIIDQVPKLEGIGASFISWKALNAIISGNNVFRSIYMSPFNVTVDRFSSIANTVINYK